MKPEQALEVLNSNEHHGQSNWRQIGDDRFTHDLSHFEDSDELTWFEVQAIANGYISLTPPVKELQDYISTINLNVPDLYRERSLDLSMQRMKESLGKMSNLLCRFYLLFAKTGELSTLDSMTLHPHFLLELSKLVKEADDLTVSAKCSHGFAQDMACDECGRSGFRIEGVSVSL